MVYAWKGRSHFSFARRPCLDIIGRSHFSWLSWLSCGFPRKNILPFPPKSHYYHRQLLSFSGWYNFYCFPIISVPFWTTLLVGGLTWFKCGPFPCLTYEAVKNAFIVDWRSPTQRASFGHVRFGSSFWRMEMRTPKCYLVSNHGSLLQVGFNM